jgi:membrane protein implicated in regulation of membrane protease activity
MTDLLSWTNLVFLIPLALGVLLTIGNAVGLGDFDLDGEVDLDADVDADVDLDADADLDADGDADADHGGGAFDVLGVGRVPLMVILICLLTSFGVIGLSLNRLLGWLPTAFAAPAAIWLSLVGSLVVTSRASRWIARLLPSVESYATDAEGLVGCAGKVAMPIDGDFGRATVLDGGGTRHELRCRTDGATLARGTEVVVTEYDAEHHVYTVVPLSL